MFVKFLLLVSLLWCTLGLIPDGCDRTINTDRELKLKVGQEARLKRERLKITLQAVAEDSRCPKVTTCVWAGNGKVVLKVEKEHEQSETIELNTDIEPKARRYLGYEVILVSLNPYPTANSTIQMRDYVATLAIQKR